MKHRTCVLVFTILCVTVSQLSFAARFGGGRSRGMQRPQQSWSNTTNNTANANNGAATNNYRSANNNYTNNTTTNQAQPPRTGMGAGTAAVLGAAAGAAGGYMLGKNAANTDNSQQAINQVNASDVAKANVTNSQPTSSGFNAAVNKPETHFPWGIISILAILLVIALAFFKKRSSQTLGDNGGYLHDNPNASSKFDIPNLRMPNDYKRSTAADMQDSLNGTQELLKNKTANKDKASDVEFMPDGIEKVYFLRQVKGMFLHVQSMNSAEHSAEIARYMTAELYAEMQQDIENNTTITKIERVNCQLLEAKIQDTQLIAAVRFDGLSTDEDGKSTEQFSEIWNFLKPDLATNKWLIAGIQQLDVAPRNN